MSKGISDISRFKTTQEQYDALGNSIIEEQSQELSTQLQVFQNLLLNYSREHSKEIMENPKFRIEFSKICSSFGVEPLMISKGSSTTGTGDSGTGSNSLESVKNEEFYVQLSIKIIELCHETQDQNGGVLKINKEFEQMLRSKMFLGVDNGTVSDSVKISEQDIIRLIEKLSVLGDELKLIQIGSNKYLKSIPHDLNTDENIILETCNLIGGYVSIAILRANFKWDKVRCKSVLNDMVSNGLLWLDLQDEEGLVLYWSPSWISNVG